MATPQRVLLLGGHGKIAMYLTPLLLAKKYNVTSVIRNHDHEKEILALGNGQPGKIETLVESLDEVKSVGDAEKVLAKVKPEVVVWAAGAGGKGGAARTFAVDRDAAKAYITASLSSPSIKKFLLISYISSRHTRAPWWTDSDWAYAQNTNFKVLANYFKAKVAADEHLVFETKRLRSDDRDFQAITLRPGTLSDDPATGKVKMGKIGVEGKIPREDVARVIAEVLERGDTKGWLDLLSGEESIESEVDRIVKEGWDGVQGEDLNRIYAGKEFQG